MKMARQNLSPACWGQPALPASGYTMVEIALAIAIIGFALVAIIGILPSGLQVQKDNREETIINQDGMFWLEAVRSGATGTVQLENFVDYVKDRNGNPHNVSIVPREYTNAYQILGTLSAPPVSINNITTNIALVRSITGPAVERGNELAFKYRIESIVLPASPNLFEIRLSFHWPIRPDGSTGNNVKVFRTLVSGTLVETDTNFQFFALAPNRF